jgi:hypothetical protein
MPPPSSSCRLRLPSSSPPGPISLPPPPTSPPPHLAELTQANAELTEALGNSDRMLKRVRRNARNSDSTMQDRINVLQNRRG